MLSVSHEPWLAGLLGYWDSPADSNIDVLVWERLGIGPVGIGKPSPPVLPLPAPDVGHWLDGPGGTEAYSISIQRRTSILRWATHTRLQGYSSHILVNGRHHTTGPQLYSQPIPIRI